MDLLVLQQISKRISIYKVSSILWTGKWQSECDQKSTYRYIYQLKFKLISYNINLNSMSQRGQITHDNLQHRGVTGQNTGQGKQGLNLQTLKNQNDLISSENTQDKKFWTKNRKVSLIIVLIFLFILTTLICVKVLLIRKKEYKSQGNSRQIILVGGQVVGITSLKSTNNSCQIICMKKIKKEKERLLQTEGEAQIFVHEIWNEDVIVTVGNNETKIHALNWSQTQLQQALAQLGNKTQVAVSNTQYTTYIYNKATNKYEVQKQEKVNNNLRRVLFQHKPRWSVEDAKKNYKKQKQGGSEKNYEGTLGPDDRKESANQFLSNCFPKSKDVILCNKAENGLKNENRQPKSWQIVVKSN